MDTQKIWDEIYFGDGCDFAVTDQHLTLLRKAWIRWDDIEFGAPAIDSKRPYGNSDVICDIAELLGLDMPDGDDPQYDQWLRDNEEQLTRLHVETGMALQIALATGEFRTGTYRKAPWSDATSWQRVEEPDQPAEIDLRAEVDATTHSRREADNA